MICNVFQSRYGRFTPLSKALQEDPSCQLCCVLQKYLLQNTTNVEENLKEADLPHLSTLRQVCCTIFVAFKTSWTFRKILMFFFTVIYFSITWRVVLQLCFKRIEALWWCFRKFYLEIYIFSENWSFPRKIRVYQVLYIFLNLLSETLQTPK